MTLIYNYCKKALNAENKVLDWILEEGDTDFIKKEQVEEFVKDRLNTSLSGIGLDPIFETNEGQLVKTKWFNEELLSDVHVDFFDQRPTAYNKFDQSFDEDSIF